jgi:TolA-binding protein
MAGKISVPPRRINLSFISFLLLFSISVPVCPADEYGQLYQTKENICSLIFQGKLSEAKAETEKMTTKYTGHEKLPGMLYWVATAYERSSIFEEAKALYRRAANDFPNNLYTAKARLGLSRVDAMSLLASGKYEQAREVTDKMVYDFADNNDLPGTLYWIGRKYEQNSNFEEAKRVFQQVIQSRPDSQYANRARLSIRQAEAILLIISENYNQAQGVIDKMAVDFAGNPDLPGTMFWITERFERQNRFEEAKNNYQRIVQNYPGHTYASKAKLGVSRMDVMSFIVSGNYDGAKAAIDKMLIDFAGKPDLPGTLYWIGRKYEQNSNFEGAKHVFQQAIQSQPDSPYADRAKLRISIADVVLLSNSQDYNSAKTALNKVVLDYKGHSDLPLALIIIGEKYYRERKAEDSIEKAKEVFRVIADELNVTERTPEACCWVGDCCVELGQYEEAITYYKRSCDGFAQYDCSPGSRFDNGFRTRSLYMIGQSYQKLLDANNMSREEAESLIIDSYERLVHEFPNCVVAKDGWRELGLVYADKKQQQDAIRCFESYLKLIPEERCPADVFYKLAGAYDQTGKADSAKKNYTKFLMSVMPADPRREEVKLRLAAMGEAD